MPKNDQNWKFLVILGQAMQAYLVPCWWVGCWLWRAGCISQDTYLLYSIESISISINTDNSRIELGGVRSIYRTLPSARLRGKGLGTNLAGGKNNFEVRRGKGNI